MIESNSIQLRSFTSADDLASETAALLAEVLSSRAARPFCVMLAGGRTPLAAYRAVCQRLRDPPGTAHLTLSDERIVPPDSPQSNQGTVLPLFRPLGFADDCLLVPDPRLSPEESADRWHGSLSSFMERGGRLALGLLGLGDDGHTASLFSAGDVASGGERLAMAVRRPTPPDRVSVTPRWLALSERLIFLVSGASKQAALDALLHRPLTLAAGLAVAGHPRVEVWTDTRAP